MQESSRAGIVTVIYNAQHHIDGFLTSLIRNKESIKHIIFVDNASRDSSLDHLSSLDGIISYEVIKNKSNIGYSAAVNQGITVLLEKEFDYILVTNNDLTIQEEGIRTLVEDMENIHADVVGVPTTNDGTTYVLDNSFDKKTGIVTYNSITKESLIEKLTLVKTIPSLYVQGGVVLFHRRFLTMIGLYDDALFFGGDELDFLLRITSSLDKVVSIISLRSYNLFDHRTHHDGRFKLRKAVMMIQGVMYVLFKHGYMPWSTVYENVMGKLLDELAKKSFKRRIALFGICLRSFIVALALLISYKISIGLGSKDSH